MAYTSTTFDPEMETTETRSARQTFERAKERTREKMQDSADMVRRNPGRAIAISLFTGVALGAILANRLMQSSRRSRLDMLADYSGDAWDRVRANLQDAMGGLREALSSAAERFR